MAKRHLSGRQLRLLFAQGILKGKGSGKNRTVTYDKSRAQSLSRLRKRGVDTTVKQKYRNTPGNSGRHVFGAKAAHLRGSGTGGKKVDHSATRAARIAAGYERLASFAGRHAATTLAQYHAKRGTPRRVMESKFPGKFLDTGERFPAGARIHYGEGPHGKGAYSTRAGGKDHTDAILKRTATNRRGALLMGALQGLYKAPHSGYERNVGGRKVIDRFTELGTVSDSNGRRGVKALFGRRVRDATRRALRASAIPKFKY